MRGAEAHPVREQATNRLARSGTNEDNRSLRLSCRPMERLSSTFIPPSPL